jgi:hypothetical protein
LDDADTAIAIKNLIRDHADAFWHPAFARCSIGSKLDWPEPAVRFDDACGS